MRTLLQGLGGCAAIIVIVVAVLAVSLGALLWGGVIKTQETQIERNVVVQSQQYITAHNQEILGLISDYTGAKDPARQAAIVNQVCLLAGEISGHVISTAQVFVAVHC